MRGKARYSATVEDYIKRLFLESEESAEVPVSFKRLAQAMGVTPGTVTSMMKSLSQAGLVRYQPRQGVQLTSRGRDLALSVVRRHRLVERFLKDVLKMNWADVHREAEALEHAVSEQVLERIDAVLGRPDHGPHGKPIPRKNGSFYERPLRRLSVVAAGDRVRVAQVEETDSETLRFAEKHGLTIGAVCLLSSADSAAGTVTVKADEYPKVTMSRSTAERFLVESG